MDGLGNSVDISLPLFELPFLLMFNKSGADADDDVVDDDDDDTRG